jgi:hypothetical protein
MSAGAAISCYTVFLIDEQNTGLFSVLSIPELCLMPKMRKLSREESIRAEQEDQELRAQEEYTVHAYIAGNTGTLDARYPSLSTWVNGGGWIEIGADHYSTSFIRVLDIGGMVWEGEIAYPSLDAAFEAADTALEQLEEAGEI